MTRRSWLQTIAGSALPLAAQSRLPEHILYRQYSRCLPDHLRALAAEASQRRISSLQQLTTPAALRIRQRWVRETFWKLAGGELTRTPLNLRITREQSLKDFRIESLVYESQPGLLVTANLYVPTSRQGPFPAVLFQAGHSPDGKAADPYQRCCQGLAKLGFVVLAFDPMGQGERTHYPGPSGATRLASVDDEHTVPGRQMLLVGDTATRLQAWDAVRSLDVLASHPQVLHDRLASTGQSGGGTLTMMLAAIDDRLHTAAVSSGNTENVACPNYLPPGSTDDAEQDFIASGPLGFDRWDLLWPFAPKPLLILTSAKDFFGTYSPSYQQNGDQEYDRLLRAYSAFGAPNNLQRGESPLPHGLAYPQRLAIFNWMERWLKDNRQTIAEEPPVEPLAATRLHATAKGNVSSMNGLTPFAMIQRQAALITTPSVPVPLRQLLGITQPPLNAPWRAIATVPYGPCTATAGEVASAEAVAVPAWQFTPRSGPQRRLLLLDPAGRNLHWREGGLAHQLAAAGTEVFAADLRGIGDMQPEFSAGAPSYIREHQSEENYAWASLIFGHSLLGQRVTDILALVHAITAATGPPLALAAKGQLTVPALCAAALDTRIASLYLQRPLASWRHLTQAEEYRHTFANFVPDILRHTDLPQLAAQLAPRPLTLATPVDANHRPALTDSLYQAPHIKITPDLEWSVQLLKAL